MYKLFIFAAAILTASSAEGKIQWPIKTTVTKWIGDIGISQTNDVILFVPPNSKFLDVMNNAAHISPRFFKFEEVQDEERGTVITSIGGLAQNEETKHYWMVYQLKNAPNHLHPPTDDQLSPVGIDDMHVSKGDHFLWWYKKVHPHN